MLNKKQRNPKAEYTVYRYTPDPEYGLDAEKVSERQAQNLTNKTSSDNRHSKNNNKECVYLFQYNFLCVCRSAFVAEVV